MAIKLQELRYIRRCPSEIAVLRELVALQRCRIINPSEAWLAQMTNLSESSVRRALVKLAKSGFISYDRHKEDFRGPNRPTNTYTLHPDRIQEAIGAGKVAVKKALGAYYSRAGIPHHSKKPPVRLTPKT
jgi:predicted transcriptional regulator